jgi:prepilin-type N-terminal cleavage/methylation domain-containing protein
MSNRKYKGMTLLESLIAIAIFSIGILGFTTLFMRSWRQNAYTLELGQATMAASQGVNEMVRHIREVRQADNGAYPVISADNNDLVVYSDYDRDSKAERLHFYKSGTSLLMGVREPSSGFPVTYAAGDGETHTISANVVNDASTPIFAYFDANYPEDSVNNPLTTPATVPNIRLVRITLHINIFPNRAPDNVQIQSFAEMRNLNDHDRFGVE